MWYPWRAHVSKCAQEGYILSLSLVSSVPSSYAPSHFLLYNTLPNPRSNATQTANQGWALLKLEDTVKSHRSIELIPSDICLSDRNPG